MNGWYVERLESGRWAVCWPDGQIVATFANRGAATRWIRAERVRA